MTRIVTTKSGTRYEFSDGKVRRKGTRIMRRDEEWLKYTEAFAIEVGKCMTLYLEPLGGGNVTIRTTTTVVSIEERENEND